MALTKMKGIDVSAFASGVFRFGGACAVGSKVVFAPCSASQIVVLDVITTEVKGIEISEVVGHSRFKFRSICSVGDKVVMAPYDATEILMFNVTTEEVKSIDIGTEIATGCAFFGVCAVGNQVVLAPFHAPQILVFDVTTETLAGIDISTLATGDAKFKDICSVGNKVVLAPYNAPQILVLDMTTKEVKGIDIGTEIATGPSQREGQHGKFCGMCAVGDKVVLWPIIASQIMIFDVISMEVKSIDIPAIVPKGTTFGYLCAVGERVVVGGKNASKLLVFDMTTEEVKDIKVPGVAMDRDHMGPDKFSGICAVEDKVVLAPYFACQILVFDWLGSIYVSLERDPSDEDVVICRTLDGSEFLRTSCPRDISSEALRLMIAGAKRVSPDRLRIVLPDGRLLTEEKAEMGVDAEEEMSFDLWQ